MASKLGASGKGRLDHISPGSGQPGKSWEFSSGEMDSELVSSPVWPLYGRRALRAHVGLDPTAFVCDSSTWHSGWAVSGMVVFAESPECLQASLRSLCSNP